MPPPCSPGGLTPRDEHRGDAEVLILTAFLPVERTAKWGEELKLAKADLEDASGALRHPDAWSSLVGRVGTHVAAAMMRCIIAHSLQPCWMAWEEAPTVGRGCRQGASESP